MNDLGIHTRPLGVSIISEPLNFQLGDTIITIDNFTNSKGGVIYRLKSFDGVVNEWNEYFASLSLALARVAVLAGIIETESWGEHNGVLFADSPDVFADKAYRFIDDSVKGI